MNKLINDPKKEFSGKDFGEVSNFLGREIKRNGNEIKILHERQIQKILIRSLWSLALSQDRYIICYKLLKSVLT